MVVYFLYVTTRVCQLHRASGTARAQGGDEEEGGGLDPGGHLNLHIIRFGIKPEQSSQPDFPASLPLEASLINHHLGNELPD